VQEFCSQELVSKEENTRELTLRIVMGLKSPSPDVVGKPRRQQMARETNTPCILFFFLILLAEGLPRDLQITTHK